MPDILRVRSTWTGFIGAPGYTNMYFIGATTSTLPAADDVANLVGAFWTAVKGVIPSDVHIAVNQDQAIVDSASGQQTGGQAATVTPFIDGGETGAYAAPVGAVVPWGGDAFINGRRVRGRSFLVPLANNAFDADGTLSGGTLQTLNAAAVALTSDADIHMVIWSRGPKGANQGTVTTAGALPVPDIAAVLRSRRQ